jgi:hypothetical protein
MKSESSHSAKQPAAKAGIQEYPSPAPAGHPLPQV